MRHTSIFVLLTSLLCACADPGDADLSSVESNLSNAQLRQRAERIRDVAASRGFTNGALLAGIARVETGLAQCYSEATWACPGPHSSYCNGPVLAGGADGACSARQGGLGMFQFDGGTYEQTLARDGVGILNLDGNISHGVDFVAGLVRRWIPGVNSHAEAIAWMNAVPVVRGDSRFQQWNMVVLSCHYNGRCNDEQANKYGDATLDMAGRFGGDFWRVTPAPGPAPMVKRLVAPANADGRLEVIYAGTDRNLYHRAQRTTGGWGDEAWLGGQARQVAAARNADGRLELVYIGTNDALYHNWQLSPNGGWYGEDALGGFAKQIAMAANADGRLELVYIGTNDALYHKWQLPGGGWSEEAWLGGQAKQVALARNTDGRLELVYVGTNDALYHNWQVSPNGGWYGEDPLGGYAKQIAMAASADGRLELVYVGTDDALYHNGQRAEGGWSGEAGLGGKAKQVALAANADGRLELVYIGTDDWLYHNWQSSPNGGWAGQAGLGGYGRQLSLARNADGRLEVFYGGTDDKVYHRWQSSPNGGWSDEDWLGGWVGSN